MKLLKRALLVWMALTAVLIMLAVAIFVRPQGTHTHSFCAYNRVFVEFEEDGRKWGTIMLDWEGRPVPCKEGLEEVPVNTKEII